MAINISRIGRLKGYGSGLALVIILVLLLLPLGPSASNGAETGVKPYPNAPASFTDLVKRVGPEVVNISTTKVITRRSMPRPFGPEGPWRDFFGDDFFERFLAEYEGKR